MLLCDRLTFLGNKKQLKMHATGTKRVGKCMQLVPSARENACNWYQARGKMHATGTKRAGKCMQLAIRREKKPVLSAGSAG